MSDGLLVVAPVLVPLVTLAAVLLVPRRVRRAVSLGGHLAFAVVAGALLVAAGGRGLPPVAFGGWDPPFAIVFSADRLSAVFVMLTALAALASAAADRRVPGREVDPPYALGHGFVLGACGVFLTGDLFNLYVWLEVVLFASLGLVAWERTAPALDAALRYLVLNVVGTAVLLAAVASIYAVTGQLNLLAVRAAAAAGDGRLTAALAVFAAACLVKAAAFPVFAWLPAAYPALPAPRAALFAAVGTKLGVYALLRVPVTLPGALPPAVGSVLGWVAVTTMIVGVLGAAHHWDIRRILAFHSVSQVGYMLLGLALGTPAGAHAAIVFALHHGVVKATLFHVAGLVRTAGGSYDLRRTGGLASSHPWLAAVFLVQALALVGVPPLSGFWAKLLVLREALAVERWTWSAVGLGVGLLTLYSMLKIWMEAFWKPHPDDSPTRPRVALPPWSFAAAAGLAAIVTASSLWPEPVLTYVGTAVAAVWEAR
ncbi:MAG: proton-conducting transporter membrane subunit [Vicinamibacterales bacterium]